MIELKHISAGYGNNPVLRDVSAAFEKGTLTGIVGVNGSGKSTLLKAVSGILPVSSGAIGIDGRPLEDMSRNEIARVVAYLAQGKPTADMTVEQIVLHGRFPHLHYPRRYRAEDREIARSVMAQVGIAELAHKPLDTLSGGMRQNAYIAMALAQGTDYVLLDEPTTYLDIAHQLNLMKLLRTLADNGKGVVAVMHDLPMAFSFSDRIILLHNGQVLLNDTPETVCGQEALKTVFGVAVNPSPDGRGYHYAY